MSYVNTDYNTRPLVLLHFSFTLLFYTSLLNFSFTLLLNFSFTPPPSLFTAKHVLYVTKTMACWCIALCGLICLFSSLLVLDLAK